MTETYSYLDGECKYHMYKYEGHSINKVNFLKKAKWIFFQNFFQKCKLCIVWNGFIVKIISFLQIHLFLGYSKWQQIKQSAPDLERSLS